MRGCALKKATLLDICLLSFAFRGLEILKHEEVASTPLIDGSQVDVDDLTNVFMVGSGNTKTEVGRDCNVNGSSSFVFDPGGTMALLRLDWCG